MVKILPEAFEELKRRLTTTSILPVPDRHGGRVVYSDASGRGWDMF